MGLGDTGANQITARTDGPSGSVDRGSLGGDLCPLGLRANHCLPGGAKQPVFGCEAQDPPVSVGGLHDRHALFHRKKHHDTLLLIH